MLRSLDLRVAAVVFAEPVHAVLRRDPAFVAEHFGSGDPDFPDDFWGQLVHPFRKTKPPVPTPKVAEDPPRKVAA